MKNYLTVNEIAKLWGVPTAQVTRYCRDGRIEGAVKEQGVWMIPGNSAKPQYGKTSVLLPVTQECTGRKALPVGITGYKEACSDYYYTDKTMLIKDLLDERAKVTLFTRPRSFGKTMTMDMLRVFFEKTGEDNSVYFQDKKIWQQGEAYRAYQGKYPVVYLSFKDAKKNSSEQMFNHMAHLIASEYRRHRELKNSEKILNSQYYDEVAGGAADISRLDISLRELTRMLHEHHGVAPVVIIDEYDTPVQQAYSNGFYDETADFMRALFSCGFKDNRHLSFAFLAGVLDAAGENIFSEVNGVKIYSVFDDRYSGYFGFTPEEVREMASCYKAEDKYDEICERYGGYRFGKTDIFNPGAVINYFSNGCQPGPLRDSGGNSRVIREVLAKAGSSIYPSLFSLLQGESITVMVDAGAGFPGTGSDRAAVYSLLLAEGCLKCVECNMSPDGEYICKAEIPNRERAHVWRKEIIERLGSDIPGAGFSSVKEAMYLEDTQALQCSIRDFIAGSVKSIDIADENGFNMMLLALCAATGDRYCLRPEREPGGRTVIALIPKNRCAPGMLIIMQHAENVSSYTLRHLAETALRQTDDKKYEEELKAGGTGQMLIYGAAFSGNRAEVLTENRQFSNLHAEST